ncbi:MAG: glycine cleavage system protein GcvH [Muribaculaceae bacterium]|nr:glycine cleavage system protein GcvH [Muribaculaceae bacterium]
MIYYSKSHEYINVDGDTGLVGISAYAAKQLGNVVYVDLPEEGDEFEQGEDFGAIESVKAASDLYAPVDIEVLEVNEELADNPRLINQDPMANHIMKVAIKDASQLDALMDPAAYDAFIASEH